MTARRVIVLALAACVFTAMPVHAALTVQQITSNAANEKGPFRRQSVTSRGQILFVDAADTVNLYNGSAIVPVQTLPGTDSVEPAVFMLGSGASPGQVVAAWRRGFGYGVVSVNGAAPVQTTQNPEAVAVADGCVFMVLQTATEGAHAYKVNPSNGTVQQLSAGDFNVGALRIKASSCTDVAWTFQIDSGAIDLQYWNGTTTATVATGISYFGNIAAGRIVYSDLVGGIQQVFAIDTDVSLTPVQLSSESDATKNLEPLTDGRHVVWYRSNGSGAELVLNGGLVFPAASLARVDLVELPFQLDRGQLLFRNAAGTYFYDDGIRTEAIAPAPATTITNPWLTDGYISFLGSDGVDVEVFRITGTTPSDSNQPSPPLLVSLTPGTGQLTVAWDRILGATSYNVYLANEPGVTKDNYLSLAGGRRIENATSPAVINVDPNNVYYVAVSAFEGGTQGPSSTRVASVTVVGNLAWQAGGGVSGTPFYAVTANPTNASVAYAGSNGSVYKSTDGGRNWASALTSTTSGSTHVTSVAASGATVFAGMRDGDMWRSVNSGTDWSEVLDATSMGGFFGSMAIDPSNANIVYAGDYALASRTSGQSMIIKSVNGGTAWAHTGVGPANPDEIFGHSLAIDPVTPATIYAAGSGTPNLARSDDGGGTWLNRGVTGGQILQAVAIDPRNTSGLYAVSRDYGVFKSLDGGSTWAAKNSGLTGVSGSPSGEYHSILVDPRDSNYLHLGAGNGYWYSINGGENWIARNTGLTPSQYIYALAMTPSWQLLAATSGGMYLLSVAPPPVVTSVAPSSGHISGGTAVTINGTGFQSGATVRFDGVAATNVVVVNATTITATTPAHGVGSVPVSVTNFDTQTGSLAGAFTYTNSPPSAPTGVVATAQTPTSVLVTWSAAASATSYEVWRKISTGLFEYIGTSSVTSFTDPSVSPSTAYLYAVKAVNSAGTSPQSASDIATTVIFTNEPLTAGVVIQAAHLSQLRNAIDAVRYLAGFTTPYTFTDAAPAGVFIRAVHVLELRSALDGALSSLGFPSGGYTDATLSGVPARAIHHQELRDRIK